MNNLNMQIYAILRKHSMRFLNSCHSFQKLTILTDFQVLGF